ncbi:hypothetical protein O181_023400 [Austropuccinia psidii MF-1]|uniref:Uncharacterized protein n=1 Tax=Austropuccinia psidii MF-1 TaxID=1389203 RepID=A0A9Q3GZ20_9BASI|nr:hypothetical protein [Austropuccinia psidii MF-1]
MEQNPPNPLQQDTPVPWIPCKQTLQQLTSGPRPSQHDEPPISGPSKPSEPHEDALTFEPEPEVALMKSTEEPFACPATPASINIINNMPIGSPLLSPSPFIPPPSTPSPEIPPIASKIPTASSCPAPSSPNYHNEAQQEFMYLQLTPMIP